MTTERSCALEGIELCLDASEVERNLRSLRNARVMSDQAIRDAVSTAQTKWADVKKRLAVLKRCDFDLVSEAGFNDITANLQNMSQADEFLEIDAPFVGNQVSRFLRFEVLTSGGRVPRT